MGFLDKIRNQPTAPAQAYDPVCGMTIAPEDAAGTSQHKGTTVHFCSAGCKRRFDADPSAFEGKMRP